MMDISWQLRIWRFAEALNPYQTRDPGELAITLDYPTNISLCDREVIGTFLRDRTQESYPKAVARCRAAIERARQYPTAHGKESAREALTASYEGQAAKHFLDLMGEGYDD